MYNVYSYSYISSDLHSYIISNLNTYWHIYIFNSFIYNISQIYNNLNNYIKFYSDIYSTEIKLYLFNSIIFNYIFSNRDTYLFAIR